MNNISRPKFIAGLTHAISRIHNQSSDSVIITCEIKRQILFFVLFTSLISLFQYDLCQGSI